MYTGNIRKYHNYKEISFELPTYGSGPPTAFTMALKDYKNFKTTMLLYIMAEELNKKYEECVYSEPERTPFFILLCDEIMYGLSVIDYCDKKWKLDSNWEPVGEF